MDGIERGWWRAVLTQLALSALMVLAAFVFARVAHAAAGAPSQCGPVSVGTGSAVAITFPASGKTGPTSPKLYLTIGNPSSGATLWVNAMPGGTAAANTAGSFQIGSGQALTWGDPPYPPPSTVSIISDTSSTPVTCAYQ